MAKKVINWTEGCYGDRIGDNLEGTRRYRIRLATGCGYLVYIEDSEGELTQIAPIVRDLLPAAKKVADKFERSSLKKEKLDWRYNVDEDGFWNTFDDASEYRDAQYWIRLRKAEYICTAIIHRAWDLLERCYLNEVVRIPTNAKSLDEAKATCARFEKARREGRA